MKISELKLIPSKGGCFELSLNGELGYSKLATGKFPDEQAMLDLIKQKIG
jgi:selenoprotein W-related protein